MRSFIKEKLFRLITVAIGSGILFFMVVSCNPVSSLRPGKETDIRLHELPSVIHEPNERILIRTDCLEAQVWPSGYVSGIKENTFVDLKTAARDNSFGLDIVDFLMAPGAEGGMPYEFGNLYHGNIAKHYIELPQVCTQAQHIHVQWIRGSDFVAVRQHWNWTHAAPGYRPGSLWEQIIIFPMTCRYVLSSDRVQSKNDVSELFLRTDLPCHIRHDKADTFEQVYLSYAGYIPAERFLEDFPPDGRYFYQRGTHPVPKRMIRAHKIRGEGMPWLSGMTLDPCMVSEAWCHQRGYVCQIQEIGRLPVKAGDSFSAAYIIGYFDSVEAMENEYDRYRGFNSLAVTEEYWLLSEGVIVEEQARQFRIMPQGQWPSPGKWRLWVHGQGLAVVNGKQIQIRGEHMETVPCLE